MRQIINQIYWDQVNAGYMAGTSLKKNANEVINFKNALMPAGKTIMKWFSNLNYQANKEVPRLPILLSNKTYKLVIDLEVKPAKTAIFCLKFFDLQTNEINKIIFTEKEKTFTYPASAVSYTLEILNGGCKEICFNRIQLGDASLANESFADFYPSVINQTSKNDVLTVLLVADSKRAREINPVVLRQQLKFNLIIGYLSWQKSDSQVKKLTELLRQSANEKIFLFSSSSNTDDFLQKYDSHFNASAEVISANQLMQKQASNEKGHWFKDSINSTDIQDAIKRVIEFFKE